MSKICCVRLFSPAFVAVALLITSAHAQRYPGKPVRFLTSEAGSVLDIATRIISPGLSEALGPPGIVANVPSALRPDTLSRSGGDGYSMALGAGTFWLTQLLQQTPLDVMRDFAPITLVET